MRRIDTDAGVLAGTVDRVSRMVVWHLECPDCATLLPLDEAAFSGRRATVCECGWKTKPVGTKERADEDGIYVYADYGDLAFGSQSSGYERDGIQRGMRL